MSISSKTRKKLWSSSGQLCAWCKKTLVHNLSDDDYSIIGDECHINSGKVDGPRYSETFPMDKINNYSNLILLCKVHHKIIDDHPEVYTADLLRETKKEHECFVKNKITICKDEEIKFLSRLTSGADILNVISNILQFGFSYDDTANKYETKLLSRFIGDSGENCHPFRFYPAT